MESGGPSLATMTFSHSRTQSMMRHPQVSQDSLFYLWVHYLTLILAGSGTLCTWAVELGLGKKSSRHPHTHWEPMAGSCRVQKTGVHTWTGIGRLKPWSATQTCPRSVDWGHCTSGCLLGAKISSCKASLAWVSPPTSTFYEVGTGFKGQFPQPGGRRFSQDKHSILDIPYRRLATFRWSQATRTGQYMEDWDSPAFRTKLPQDLGSQRTGYPTQQIWKKCHYAILRDQPGRIDRSSRQVPHEDQ